MNEPVMAFVQMVIMFQYCADIDNLLRKPLLLVTFYTKI